MAEKVLAFADHAVGESIALDENHWEGGWMRLFSSLIVCSHYCYLSETVKRGSGAHCYLKHM